MISTLRVGDLVPAEGPFVRNRIAGRRAPIPVGPVLCGPVFEVAGTCLGFTRRSARRRLSLRTRRGSSVLVPLCGHSAPRSRRHRPGESFPVDLVALDRLRRRLAPRSRPGSRFPVLHGAAEYPPHHRGPSDRRRRPAALGSTSGRPYPKLGRPRREVAYDRSRLAHGFRLRRSPEPGSGPIRSRPIRVRRRSARAFSCRRSVR